jgi:hypothetical protein
MRAGQVTGQGQQLLAREKTQPEEEGHVRLFQILRQAREGVEIGFLNDVRGVDAALQAPVEA